MNRMDHSVTPFSRMDRRERGRKVEGTSPEFRKSFHEAMQKTRKKWKAQLREELELEDALAVPEQQE